MRRVIIGLVSGLLTLGLLLGLGIGWAVWTYQGPGPAAKGGAEQHVVVLRRGAGLNEIASALEKGGAVRSAAVFVAAAQVTGAARALKAGEYEFPSRASMATVLDYIRDGRVVVHQVTIPEGWTVEMAVEALMKEEALVGEVATPPEGSILPQTYAFERGEERSAVMQRMMDARDKLLADLWPKRKAGLPIRTPEEAIILASIVEKETGVKSERPRVAAVFVNRLNKGMRLESDPTIIYGLTKGRPLGRGIRRSELERPNPYSTYQIFGLPPTPIANPGEASIAAVLDPPDSDEIFFVADGTGGHAFATTLDEHNANVARWRQIEAQRQAAGN
ncbi:endolytic transglycosylase MltG [Caulobacter sp. SLTY]|uniref:endolytic transglycosylase MltG n=1 Tax=Caulobacter sp. SLTY TaxID=2683262 RepID=UPI00141269CC|nr:endolytic transglycosylase MltG [Caulobacter sp. SLTY]NBB17076.1 endolytic transglycosylase MltG [Caulobacter sp. SLTY]